jgi:hypothetical protein
MSEGHTIEEIQREFFVVASDVEELTRSLERMWAAIERRIAERGGDHLARRELEEARDLGARLLSKLEEIERRMSMRARMARHAV